MNSKRALIALTVAMGALALSGNSIAAQQQDDGEPPELGFFVTSVGIGDGGNLGGLEVRGCTMSGAGWRPRRG